MATDKKTGEKRAQPARSPSPPWHLIAQMAEQNIRKEEEGDAAEAFDSSVAIAANNEARGPADSMEVGEPVDLEPTASAGRNGKTKRKRISDHSTTPRRSKRPLTLRAGGNDIRSTTPALNLITTTPVPPTPSSRGSRSTRASNTSERTRRYNALPFPFLSTSTPDSQQSGTQAPVDSPSIVTSMRNQLGSEGRVLRASSCDINGQITIRFEPTNFTAGSASVRAAPWERQLFHRRSTARPRPSEDVFAASEVRNEARPSTKRKGSTPTESHFEAATVPQKMKQKKATETLKNGKWVSGPQSREARRMRDERGKRAAELRDKIAVAAAATTGVQDEDEDEDEVMVDVERVEEKMRDVEDKEGVSGETDLQRRLRQRQERWDRRNAEEAAVYKHREESEGAYGGDMSMKI